MSNQLVPKEFGPSLIQQAQERTREAMGQASIAEVQHLLSGIEQIKENIRVQEVNLDLYNRRIEAVEKGYFKLNLSGVNMNAGVGDKAIVGRRIIYNDPELNRF